MCVCVCHILLTTYWRMTRVFKEMMPTGDPLLSFKKMDHFPGQGVWNQVLEGSERLQGQVIKPFFSAALCYCITPFFFFDMGKPDGSTVLLRFLEYRPFSMQPLLALLPPFLARLVSLTAAALPSKAKDFLAVPVSRNSRGRTLGKEVSIAEVQLNETQWLQHSSTIVNIASWTIVAPVYWTLQTLQAVFHTTWLPRASSASLTSFRRFWNSTARRALVWMLQLQVPHSPW